MSVVTTSIILAMQGNLVISLGMVGALSIVRFRNAVKSSLDLLFLFWSISTGIVCGAGLFTLAVATSLIMTVIVLGLDFIPTGSASYILMLTSDTTFDEHSFTSKLKSCAHSIKVRTRSITQNEQELLLELRTKKDADLMELCRHEQGVLTANLIFHDGEVRF